MKFCPNCRATYDDAANVCGQCGGQLVYIQPQPASNPADHTAEFNPADISDNKVLAMAPYLLGWMGIIIALLAAGTSPYTAFHVKQALKIQIGAVLVAMVGAVIPIIGWIVAGVYAVVSFVITFLFSTELTMPLTKSKRALSAAIAESLFAYSASD